MLTLECIEYNICISIDDARNEKIGKKTIFESMRKVSSTGNRQCLRVLVHPRLLYVHLCKNLSDGA